MEAAKCPKGYWRPFLFGGATDAIVRNNAKRMPQQSHENCSASADIALNDQFLGRAE